MLLKFTTKKSHNDKNRSLICKTSISKIDFQNFFKLIENILKVIETWKGKN